MSILNAFKVGTVVGDFKSLNLTQLGFLSAMITTMVGLSVYWQDSLVSTLAGITGVICVFLVNMRKLSNFSWGFLNAGLYGYVAYSASFYGDTMLNWVFYLPVQLIGAYYWAKSMEDGNVETKKVSTTSLLYMTALTLIVISLYKLFLQNIGGSLSLLDSTTTVLSILATFLMIKGYREQWLCWIVVNLTSIAMWYIASAESGAGYGVLLMWVMFLLNSLYGAYNWFKVSK